MRAETIFKRATEAYRKGDFDRALQCCDELLGDDADAPARAAVLNLKAISLAGLGLMLSAADCIEAAIQIKPGDAILRIHAARILLALGRHEAAGRAAAVGCELAPANMDCRYQLARAYLLAGDSVKAGQLAQQCVNEDPAQFESWLLLSELAADVGDSERAVACLREIVRRDPAHVRAWAALAAISGQADADPAIERALLDIEAAAKDSSSSATATFALADLARQRGQYQAAFARYRSANDRLARSQPFALEAWRESQLTTVASSSKWLESATQARPVAADNEGTKAGTKLVFVVGMPRSGTSLSEQILCSHSDVLAAGELASMEYIAKSLAHEGIDPYEVGSDPAWLERMRGVYLSSLPARAADHARVIDKTPRNFERLGLIFRLFPEARVFWCLRHPLDTILSCYFQDFRGGQHFSNNLEQCAHVYLEHIQLMRHWLRYFADSIDVIDYATVVQNLAATAHAMADFIGVEFQPAMLQPWLNTRNVRTASSQQLRQPVFTTSLNQWRHYREELAGVCGLLQQHGLLDQHGRSLVLPRQGP